jgi:hypothetical protein
MRFEKSVSWLFSEEQIEKKIVTQNMSAIAPANEAESKRKVTQQKSCKIPLRNKKGTLTGYTIVDAEDYDEFSKYKWHKNEEGYAESTINGKTVLLHEEVMKKMRSNVGHKKLF